MIACPGRANQPNPRTPCMPYSLNRSLVPFDRVLHAPYRVLLGILFWYSPGRICVHHGVMQRTGEMVPQAPALSSTRAQCVEVKEHDAFRISSFEAVGAFGGRQLYTCLVITHGPNPTHSSEFFPASCLSSPSPSVCLIVCLFARLTQIWKVMYDPLTYGC